MGDPSALAVVVATVSAICAVSCIVVLGAAWMALWDAPMGASGALFVRVAGAVLTLTAAHHACDTGAALWGVRYQVDTAVGAALGAMSCVGAWFVVRHGGMLRHVIDAPNLLRFAVARASVAEAALGDLRADLMGDVRIAVDTASRRVQRVESRLVRDIDATMLIAKLLACMSAASVVVGADGALVVVAGNDAFWRLSAVAKTRGVRLSDALCLDDLEAARLLRLFDREGAKVVVDAVVGDGLPRRVELETVYLPAERGGRMWVVCRPV